MACKRILGWTVLVLLGPVLFRDAAHAQSAAEPTEQPSIVAVGRTERGRFVQSLTFSPNGKVLAGGTTDCAVYFWLAGSGKALGSIPGNPTSSLRQGVAFSPDGRTLAACAPDGALCVWEVVSGKKRLRLGSPGQQGVPSVAFSPDGKLVAGTDPGYQGRARVWDAETGQEVAQLHGGPEIVYHLAFAPDGKQLVGTGYFRNNVGRVPGVHVWDALTGKHVRAVFAEASGDSCASFALSPDGKTAALGWSGHTLDLWDVAAGKRLYGLERHGNQVLAVAFSPDGKLLASGCENGKVGLFEVATGRMLANFGGKQAYLAAVAFSPDGKWLAVGGIEPTTSSQLADAVGSVHVYDLTTLVQAAGARAVTLTPKEQTAIFSDLEGEPERRAFRAIFTLIHAPSQAVDLLKSRLKPAEMPAAEAKQLARWIAELGSDQQAVRDQAAAQLERLGQAAEPALRTALAANPAAESRKRLEWLVGELRGLEPTPAMRLARRAAEVLERLATPQARQLLAELAQGAPEAWLTYESRLALGRLDLTHQVGTRRVRPAINR
jgi:WD40 repeat protein